MIAPRKIKFEAEKKRNENYEFRIFLKENADAGELDEQFRQLHKELFAGYDCSRCRNCCKCTMEVFRRKILQEMRNIWGSQKCSLLKNIWQIKMAKTDTRLKTRPVIFLRRMETAAWADCRPESCKKIRIRISRTGGQACTVFWMSWRSVQSRLRFTRD